MRRERYERTAELGSTSGQVHSYFPSPADYDASVNSVTRLLRSPTSDLPLVPSRPEATVASGV